MEYKEVETDPEELDEGTFDFVVALGSRLDNSEIKYAIESGLEELDEALCWRDGIDGDKYPYNHLQTDYPILPLQKVELEVESKDRMVVTLTYTPYEDGRYVTSDYVNEGEHSIRTPHWEITESERGGSTQEYLRIVQKIYTLRCPDED